MSDENFRFYVDAYKAQRLGEWHMRDLRKVMSQDEVYDATKQALEELRHELIHGEESAPEGDND